MRTICYVILNYKTYEEAAACAESILSTQTWKNMHIVIVDNGSGKRERGVACGAFYR